jgi:riboflavin transporter
MEFQRWITLGLVLVYAVFFVRAYAQERRRVSFNWVRFSSRVAVFGAFSAILYVVPVFQIQLPFLPTFLQLHFDEIPAFIAGFAYGPLTGFFVILIKTLIKLPMTSTLGVGELSDLIFSSAFVIPSALIYKKMRNMKGVAIGFAVSTVLQLIVSSVLNVYAMLPFYMTVMGFSYSSLLQACQIVNPAITDLGWTYALFAIFPLNLIKDGIVIVITFLVYRSIHRFLHFEKA